MAANLVSIECGCRPTADRRAALRLQTSPAVNCLKLLAAPVADLLGMRRANFQSLLARLKTLKRLGRPRAPVNRGN